MHCSSIPWIFWCNMNMANLKSMFSFLNDSLVQVEQDIMQVFLVTWRYFVLWKHAKISHTNKAIWQVWAVYDEHNLIICTWSQFTVHPINRLCLFIKSHRYNQVRVSVLLPFLYSYNYNCFRNKTHTHIMYFWKVSKH